MTALGGAVAKLRANPTRLTWSLIGAFIAVGTVIRIPQLAHSLAEAYAFRQTQTAFPVREYAQNGINLLATPLPVFGPDANVPMEFPLFQGIAALLVPLGLTPESAARLIGLLAFQASAVLLALLVVRWHGRAVAVVAVALFEFIPYGLLWGAASLIDFMAVALALLMVVGLDRWFNRGSVWWLVAAAVGAIAGFLVKVTTIPSWGILVLVSLILVIRERGWAASWKRIVVGLAVAPGVGFIAALAWTAYADRIKSQQELTGFLTSAELRNWNFGTLAQRIDPQNYLVIVDRIAQEIAGPVLIGLLVAIAAAIYHRSLEQRVRTLGWLAVAVSAPLVFFNLYFVHAYYLIAIYPAIVVAMSIGLVWLVRALPGVRWQRFAVGGVLVALLFAWTASSPNGRANLGQFITSNPRPALASLLLDQTQPDDLIVMIGCDWDPTFLYYGERAGVMFRDADAGTFWQTNDVSDYSALFSCNADLDPAKYLPAGTTLAPTGSSGFFTIESR